MGLTKRHEVTGNAFEFNAVAAEAMLLIDDNALIEQIRTFIGDITRYDQELKDGKANDADYIRAFSNSRKILDDLRALLRNKKLVILTLKWAPS